MGVRDSYIKEHTKSVSIVLNLNNFNDVIEWIEMFKTKIQKNYVQIQNIKIIVNVDYFQE